MNLFAEEPEKSTGTGDADPRTAEKYREAVGLYGSTVLSVRAICARCGVSYAGFRSYLYKYRRDLLLSRHGVAVPSVSDAARTRLRGCRGQTASARAKYGDAIAACGDAKYFEYNVSQIAHLFGLNPTGLSNQLRAHCPGFSNAGSWSVGGWVLRTTSSGAFVRGAGSSTPQPSNCFAQLNLRCRRLPSGAGSPLPGFVSMCASITRICSRRAANCASVPRHRKEKVTSRAADAATSRRPKAVNATGRRCGSTGIRP